jgi:general transcription factor 3C protein 4
MVQTCIGCARKAFLPTTRSLHQQNQGEKPIGGVGVSERTVAVDPSIVGGVGTENPATTRRGWVVQELLKAVPRCLFCGNNFAILI